jgi:hypothetical protein
LDIPEVAIGRTVVQHRKFGLYTGPDALLLPGIPQLLYPRPYCAYPHEPITVVLMEADLPRVLAIAQPGGYVDGKKFVL